MSSYKIWNFSIKNILFRLKTVATTDTLVSVMKGMADMMHKTN
jgi:hypothetical protein